MDDLLSSLGLTNFEALEELPNARISNLDEDKILIILQIDELNEIPNIVHKLPSLRKTIMSKINNPKNKESVQDKRIPMSKFLWDMYIVALHKVENEDTRFNSGELAEYERDRFIARKIIIEYKDNTELQDKFDKQVFPERVLNRFSMLELDDSEPEIDYNSIENLLENIEDFLKKEI